MSDLSDLADVYYDILAFLVQLESSHYSKLPEFKQNETRIAVLEAPHKEALDNGLRIDILAPSPNAPSMTMALENTFLKLIKENNY
jgi:uroporphyrinogen-III synthase